MIFEFMILLNEEEQKKFPEITERQIFFPYHEIKAFQTSLRDENFSIVALQDGTAMEVRGKCSGHVNKINEAYCSAQVGAFDRIED